MDAMFVHHGSQNLANHRLDLMEANSIFQSVSKRGYQYEIIKAESILTSKVTTNLLRRPLASSASRRVQARKKCYCIPSFSCTAFSPKLPLNSFQKFSASARGLRIKSPSEIWFRPPQLSPPLLVQPQQASLVRPPHAWSECS